MNHSFIKSTSTGINSDKCAKCNMPLIAHTDMATCDCCPKIGPVEVVYGNMLMCSECRAREFKTSQEHMSESNQKQRVADMNAALMASRSVDNGIEVKTDLFNAATVAIVDLKKLIDDNPEITNKPFALASELKNRFEHFKSVIFDMNEKIIEAGNNQKAIQVYLNNLANQLRADERERLKIADINYHPSAPKQSKPKTIKVSSAKKLDKVELKKYAMELNIPEFTLQMLVVSKGITVEAAANMLRRSIKESLSEVSNEIKE